MEEAIIPVRTAPSYASDLCLCVHVLQRPQRRQRTTNRLVPYPQISLNSFCTHICKYLMEARWISKPREESLVLLFFFLTTWMIKCFGKAICAFERGERKAKDVWFSLSNSQRMQLAPRKAALPLVMCPLVVIRSKALGDTETHQESVCKALRLSPSLHPSLRVIAVTFCPGI